MLMCKGMLWLLIGSFFWLSVALVYVLVTLLSWIADAVLWLLMTGFDERFFEDLE